jgi:hypothetical protein
MRTASYLGTIECDGEGVPVELRLIVTPRGCSAMTMSYGGVVVKEIKE